MKKLFLILAGLLVSTAALAADPLEARHGSDYSSIIFLVIFVLIFYFLLIRPQMRRSKETRQMMSQLGMGDEVVTQGGIVGKISKMDDGFVSLTVAENVTIKFQKQAISKVLPKGTVNTLK